MYAPSESWDLEVLFPGGPTSPAYLDALGDHEARIAQVDADLAALPAIADDVAGWQRAVASLIEVSESLWGLQGLAHCHAAANTDDRAGRTALARADDVRQKLAPPWTRLGSALRAVDDATLDALVAGGLDDWRESFRNTREGERLKLEPALQGLLAQVDREALHGWGQLYTQVTSTLSVPFERDGEVRDTGIGQLVALRADPDPDIRERAFVARTQAFDGVLDICATALTHITGTRQTRFDRVGASEIAKTLHDNRIDEAVLDAMWEGVAARRPIAARYLDLKARALGKPALEVWDLDAPLGTPPGDATLTWSDAQALVVDAFREVEPALADFAVQLLRAGGVEAADRPNKRSGAFCWPAQPYRTTRVFLTFSGSIDNVLTLAHELGHAWHTEVLYDEPRGRRQVTTGLAESASILAENIVRDRLLAAASSPAAELFMLDQQLQASTALLMNVAARYRIERGLYALRRKGPLTADALTALTREALIEAYDGRLASWDERLWATKMHFYIPHFGFYNWPYTFGYLFSSAIYQRAVDEGAAFRPVLRELLKRTGWQHCRPLAHEMLGADLTDPAFWAGAAAPLEGTLARFESALASR